jgi:prophage regulatory protein
MNDSLLRFKDVQRKTGLSRTTIWRLERDGNFPKHISISARATGWSANAVEGWIAERLGAASVEA